MQSPKIKTCSIGHPLVKTVYPMSFTQTQYIHNCVNGATFRSTYDNWICNKCYSNFITTQHAPNHCGICEYDLCDTCLMTI